LTRLGAPIGSAGDSNTTFSIANRQSTIANRQSAIANQQSSMLVDGKVQSEILRSAPLRSE
jgi:hypothetical protein